MNEATRRFVRQHADDDVSMLALHGKKEPEVDLTAALQQIKGLQTARRKLPAWAANEDIMYPPHLSMEQCSSEQAARYKAEVARKIMEKDTEDSKVSASNNKFCDLTGGLGVDFSYMAPCFLEAVYVERQEELCRLAQHNFKVLGLKNVTVVNADGAEFLKTLTAQTDLLFLDPARRDGHGGRTYGIGDCTPNVLQLMPLLLERSKWVMLKLSPMLDWRKTVEDLGPDVVKEVHIVSVAGECKELLMVLSKDHPTKEPQQNLPHRLRLVCENDGLRFAVEEPKAPTASTAPILPLPPQPSLFLYEPNASVMKAGCFAALCHRFGISQLAQNSHLFCSEKPIDGFPGRGFLIEQTVTMNKKELKQALNGIRQANITVRNFPLSVAELRKRLKISEGGSTYIFATTLAKGTHVLIICQRH